MAGPGSAAHLALVGMPEIARIAGVGASAVGNWRKRHPSFPTPKVQTPSGALFDLDEVERWLVENGKIAERVPASARLAALTGSARTVWRPEQVASFCVGCLVYFEVCERARMVAADGGRPPLVPEDASWGRIRQEERPTEFVRGLRRAAEQIEDLNPELSGLLTPGLSDIRLADGALARSIALALDGATGDLTPRSDLLEQTTADFHPFRETPRGHLSRSALAGVAKTDRFAAEHSTPDDLAYLLSQLVSTRDGVIFDPAAGEGGLLLLAAMWRYREGRPVTLVGVEADDAVRRIARARCYLYGLDTDIRLGDALAMDLSQFPMADSVVLDPPYDLGDWGNADIYLDRRWEFGPPPPKRADYAWLQLAALHLKPAGRAGVLLPAASLSRGGREAKIRQAMIDAGVVEAVVLLPARLRVDTSVPLAVWLLRSLDAAAPEDELLLVDASDLGHPGRSRVSLEEETIDRLAALLQLWRSHRQIPSDDAEIAVAVPQSEITDGDLDPRRYWKAPPIDVPELERAAREQRGKVQQTLAEVREALALMDSWMEGDR